jgi:hypothetical protein
MGKGIWIRNGASAGTVGGIPMLLDECLCQSAACIGASGAVKWATRALGGCPSVGIRTPNDPL